MSKSSASAALPPEDEREIRRLRFSDPHVEQAFRQEYAEKTRRPVRLVMMIQIPVQVVHFASAAVAGFGALSEPASRFTPAPAGVLAGTLLNLWPLLMVAGGVWLSYSRHFARFAHIYIGFFLLLFGLRLVETTLAIPTGFSSMIVFVSAVYTLSKMRLAPAMLVAWTVLAAFEARSVWGLHTPPEVLQAQNFPILLTSLFALIAGYTMEYAARQDFLLLRLLKAERQNVETERQRSERLLLNILPAPIAERLKEAPAAIADRFAQVSVLFADIVDFTPLAARLSAEETVALLGRVFSCFDRLAEKHGLEKIKTIGDAYMVVAGLPGPREDHAEACVEMALEMQQEIGGFHRDTGEPLALRIGINSGPVVAGVIGTRKLSYDLWGDTVNVASRMESQGLPGRVQVTAATYERLRGRYGFAERHLPNVKGRGEMTAYLLC